MRLFISLDIFILLMRSFIPLDFLISFVYAFVPEFVLISAVVRVTLIGLHDDRYLFIRDVPTWVMSAVAGLIMVGTGALKPSI